jgi:hypothetical protein
MLRSSGPSSGRERYSPIHKDLARKLEELEKKYDEQFAVVFEAIRELMTPPEPPPKRRIGFGVEEKRARYE